jgi:hypothetical protein
MKIEEGLEIINDGWIRKPKGFRVRFDKRTDSGFEVVYSPSLEDAPLDSDVTAWRYAWKLWQATQADSETDGPGALYNIVVVDDSDQPIRFYVTNKPMVHNPKQTDRTIDAIHASGENSGKTADSSEQ